MGSSLKQREANQQNALKSTGPRTVGGKAAVAGNALKHGILSNRLVLPDENAVEFQVLLDGLSRSLCPVGDLELTLVEKIAINLWRQRRLVKAEQAGLVLSRQAKHVADQVSEELGIGAYSSRRVTVDDLEGVDEGQVEWCKAVIQEYDQLPQACLHDLAQLREEAPRIHEQLAKDAAHDKMAIEGYLEEHDGGLTEYLSDLLRYCREEIQRAVRFPVVQEIAELVTAQRAIPPGEARDKLGRYQAMLDNDLYKAMKALRDAQQWRLASIDVTNEAGTMATSEAC